MLKKLFFSIVLIAAASCTKEPIQEPDAIPVETWRMELLIHFADGDQVFELESTDVRKLVGSYDPATGQNPQVGKTLNFADRVRQFNCTCYYQFDTGTVDRIDGNYDGKSFGNVLNPVNSDGTTVLNFCNGPQKVPAELFVVRIQ